MFQKMQPIYFQLFILILLCTIASCGAHSPKVLDDRYQTIHVPVFKNETLQFGIEESLTRATIEAFQRDGRLKVTPESSSDLQLKVTIKDVHVDPVAFSDIDRAVGFSMTVMILAQAVNTNTGEVVMPERPFVATGAYLLSNNPGTTKSRDISNVLAEQILSFLVEGW